MGLVRCKISKVLDFITLWELTNVNQKSTTHEDSVILGLFVVYIKIMKSKYKNRYGIMKYH